MCFNRRSRAPRFSKKELEAARESGRRNAERLQHAHDIAVEAIEEAWGPPPPAPPSIWERLFRWLR